MKETIYELVDSDWFVSIILLIGMFVIVLVCIHLISPTISQIQEQGLKTIFNSIWCGAKGC